MQGPFSICGPLERISNSSRFRDIGLFCGRKVDFSGSRDVICHVTSSVT